MKVHNINEVELVGAVANVFHSRNFLSITISTTRFVTGNGGRSIRNFPHVVWYGEAAQELADSFKKGDRVKVTAEVDTSHFTRDRDRRRRQTVFTGKTIELAKGTCEETFGIKSAVGDRISDVNKVSLAGRVMSTYCPNQTDQKSADQTDQKSAYAKVTIQVIKDNRFDYPEIYCFGKLSDFVRSSIKKDDYVCVTGSIQTSSRGEGDERRYLENIVCSEIAIINEEE